MEKMTAQGPQESMKILKENLFFSITLSVFKNGSET